MKDQVIWNKKVALIVSFIAVIASFYFSFVVYYLRKCASMDIRLWDSKTATAADFTVQIPITNEIWLSYQNDLHSKMHHNHKCKHDKRLTFKEVLRYTITEHV